MAEIRREDPRIRVNSDWADFQRDMRRNIELVNDLERATRGISANVGNIGGGTNTAQLRNTARALDDTSRAAERTNRGFNLLRATAASLAGNVGSNLVFGLQDAIVNFVRLGVEMERSTTRFVAFADSADEGRRQLRALFNTAQELGVAFQPLVDLGTAFRAAGFEAEEMTDLIRRLTIAAGGSAQAVDSISRSLRQIKTGKVELEELNPIAEAGIPIFQLLADQIGVTTRELRDLIRTGDVSQTDFFAAFRTFTDEGSKAAEAADETADTISASVNRIKNNILDLAGTIIERFSPDVTSALETVATGIDNINQSLQPDEAADRRQDINEEYGLRTVENIGDFYNELENFAVQAEGTMRYLANLLLLFIAHQSRDTIEGVIDEIEELTPDIEDVILTLTGKIARGVQGETYEEALRYAAELFEELDKIQLELNSLINEGAPGNITAPYFDVVDQLLNLLDAQAKHVRQLQFIEQGTAAATREIVEYTGSIRKLTPLLAVFDGIEEDRLKKTKEINKELELGFITEEEHKQRISDLNKDLLVEYNTLIEDIQEGLGHNLRAVDDIESILSSLPSQDIDSFQKSLRDLGFSDSLIPDWQDFLTHVVGVAEGLETIDEITERQRKAQIAEIAEQYRLYGEDARYTANAIEELVALEQELFDSETARREAIKELGIEASTTNLTEIEQKTRLRDLNREAITQNQLILDKIKEILRTLSDTSSTGASDRANIFGFQPDEANEIIERWREFYREAKISNEELLRLAGELTRELANQGEEEINRLTLNRLIKDESQRRYEIEQGIGGELSEQIDALSIYEVALRRLNNLRVESDFASRFQSESQTDDSSGGTAIRDKPNPFDLDFLKFGDNPFQDFLDSNLFEEIERLASNLGSVFSSIGEIIRNGANAELARMEKHLDELVAKNRELAEDINAQYELDRQDLEDNLESNLEGIEEERDELIDKYEVERSEGKLTAQQLADAKKKADQDYQKEVREIRRENEDAQKELARKRKKDLDDLKNEENKVRNQINEHKWRADIENFHFQQGIRLAQVAYETALAVVRSFPNPFAIGGALAAGVFATGAILSARPPEKPTPIPVYGDGGYVDSPTLAIVGDKGGELMIPERFIGRMGNTYIHQTVEGDVIREEDTGDYIIDIFKRARKNRIGIS